MKRTICIAVAITIAFMIAVFAGSDKDTRIAVQNPQLEASLTAVPEEINYQGVLTDPSGTVVPDNTYNITFRLYSAATGGIPLWTGSQSVATHGGLFNVLLPIPSSHFDGSERWLGIEVNNDGEMVPRQQLASVPHAYRDGVRHSLDAADGDPVDALYVDDDGNVGIGTATPMAKLDVDGDVYFEGGDGDANADGSVNMLDPLLVTDYFLGISSLTKQQYANADVDGDGRVTLEDLYMIGNLLLGFTREETKKYFHSLYGGALNNTFYVNGKIGVGTDDAQAELDVTGSVYFEGGDGDVDLSGDLGVLDPITITNYLLDLTSLTKEQYAHADVDGDGRVTSDDAVIVANLILGIPRDDAIRMVHSVYGVGSGGFFVNANTSIDGSLNATELTGPWDNSSSDYIRLGDIQICWGETGLISSSGYEEVTYPQPFSEIPMVQVSSTYRGIYNVSTGWAGTDYRTASSTRIYAETGSSNRACWIAIGKWR